MNRPAPSADAGAREDATALTGTEDTAVDLASTAAHAGLLARHDPSGSDEDLGGLTRLLDVPHPDGEDGCFLPGQRVGPYRIGGVVGRGGMGIVYRAEQLMPVRRTVALKLVQQRLKGSLAEAFFLREREALAQLDHPAIARVHDAGTLPDGSLFFAMEWIEGRTVDQVIGNREMDLKQFLRFLVACCQGVHHAHRRGIIHRDLKPSNILVATVDGAPCPKLIDFGIARRGASREYLPGHATVGTRGYMSPEQMRGSTDVDVRTDVYALGVLLAECLCLLHGLTPVVARERKSHDLRGAFAASLGRFEEVAMQGALADFARSARVIPAELRAIAVKAMAPDRNLRYDGAVAFADDLRRFQRHEMVSAMPRRGSYAVGKFVARHPVAVLAGGIGTALLAAFAAAAFQQRAEAGRLTMAVAAAEERALAMRQAARIEHALIDALLTEAARAGLPEAFEVLAVALPDRHPAVAEASTAARRLLHLAESAGIPPERYAAWIEDWRARWPEGHREAQRITQSGAGMPAVVEEPGKDQR